MRPDVFGIGALVVEVLARGAIIGHEYDQRVLVEPRLFQIVQQSTSVIVEVIDHRGIEFHLARLAAPLVDVQLFPGRNRVVTRRQH